MLPFVLELEGDMDRLKRENRELIEANSHLKEDKDTLQAGIESRNAKTEDLENELNHDELTGLLSQRGRDAKVDHLANILQRPSEQWIWRENDQPEETIHTLGVVVFDLDDFSNINNQHGHKIGDEALKLWAELLRRSFRETDIVARSSRAADEFIALVPMSFKDQDRVERTIKDKIFACLDVLKASQLADPEQLEEWIHQLNSSVGIETLALSEGMDVAAAVSQAISRADDAMYEHKRSSKENQTSTE